MSHIIRPSSQITNRGYRVIALVFWVLFCILILCSAIGEMKKIQLLRRLLYKTTL